MIGLINRRYSDEFHSENVQLELVFESCSRKGSEELAKRSIDDGLIDVNARGIFGDSALHFAAHSGNVDGIMCLIERGADINSKNNLKVTPLGKAVAEGHIDAIKCLLENGADMNTVDDVPATPLMAAARRCRIDVLELLLHHGAHVNMADNFGNTALHFAAAEGHLSTVQLLLNFGADPEISNCRSQTPFDVVDSSWVDNLTKKKIKSMLSSEDEAPSF
mmetsp:Transcript_17949/g.26580  ORF Transcript_17949/g.26580 Transcript_17949/m.26580 type:complete len:220 (+) Transcript_17949:55-714(+)